VKVKLPPAKECACGDDTLLFTRLEDHVHAGKFECYNCGAFKTWAATVMKTPYSCQCEVMTDV